MFTQGKKMANMGHYHKAPINIKLTNFEFV